jgi:hypothetical protein
LVFHSPSITAHYGGLTLTGDDIGNRHFEDAYHFADAAQLAPDLPPPEARFLFNLFFSCGAVSGRHWALCR